MTLLREGFFFVYNGDGMGFFCVLVSDLGRIWRLREGQDGSETSSDAF